MADGNGNLDGTALAGRVTPRRWHTVIAATLILASGLAVYHNTRHCPFIFDDLDSIENNATIRQVWPVWVSLNPPRNREAVQCRPLVNLSLAINRAVAGWAHDRYGGPRNDVFWYHLWNTIVHLLNALLVFGIVRRTLALPDMPANFRWASTWLGLAVGLIWTVHPLNTEAVTYTIQRTESMMGLFFLLTMYGLLRGATSRRGWPWYGLSCLACLLGVGCKEVIAVAPVAALAYDRVYLSKNWRELLGRRWFVYVGYAVCLAALGCLLWRWGDRSPAVGFSTSMSVWEYARTQFGAIITYLGLAFWPDQLTLDYGTHVANGFSAVFWPGAAVGLLLALTGLALWYRPRWGFLGLWFFAILAPSSSIMPLATQTIAEKRTYLPLVAVVTVSVVVCYWVASQLSSRLVGRLGPSTTAHPGEGEKPGGGGRIQSNPAVLDSIGLPEAIREEKQNDMACFVSLHSPLHPVFRRHPPARNPPSKLRCGPRAVRVGGRALAILALGSLAVALGWRTISRNDDYRSAMSIWQDTAAKRPDNGRAWYNLGREHLIAGNADRDGAEVRQALRMFDRAIADGYEDCKVYTNRALARLSLADQAGALADLDRALTLNRSWWEALLNRGGVRTETGDYAGAIADLTRAVDQDGQSAAAYASLGRARWRAGDVPGAIRDLTRAIELNDSDAAAWHNRGLAHFDAGQLGEAIGDYSQAIRLDGRLADAYHDRANAYLLTGGMLESALADYDRAILLDPGKAQYFTSRGEAWRRAGKFAAAISDLNRAIVLDSRSAIAHFTLGQVYANRHLVSQRAEDLDAAIAELSRTIELADRDPRWYAVRASLFRRKGDIERARQDVETCQKLGGRVDPGL